MIPKEQILNIQSSIDVCKKDLIEAINNYGDCDIKFNMIIEGESNEEINRIRVTNISKGRFTFISNIFDVEEIDNEDLHLLTINELYEIFSNLVENERVTKE